jgi:imidazolonepropionase-like amidohydrolase
MDGTVIQSGTLLVKGGKIVALGPGVKIPILSKKVDAQGGTVSPGLIDVMSALGAGPSAGRGAGPTRRAEDAFDRYDTAALVDALRNGVTAVYLAPEGSAGICGTGAVLRLTAGPDREQSFGQVLGSEAALCIDLGSTSSGVTRLKALAAVRKQFRDAREHRRSLEEYEEKLAEYKKKLKERAAKKKPAKKEPPKKDPAKKEPPKKEPPKKDPAKDKEKPARSNSAVVDKKEEDKKKEGEAKPDAAKKPAEAGLKKPPRPARKPKLVLLLRAIDHEIPVRVRARRSEDILNALELAREFHLDLILEGAAEAHLVASQIAEAKVPVVLGSMSRSGVRRDDPFRRSVRDRGRLLSAAGVRWVIGSGAQSPASARFVALNAQLATAHDPGHAPLRSVTADAADALRVAGEIGRLRPGLLADFVLWSGDPLDPETKVQRVYVGGALVYQAPQQTKKGGAK